MERYFHFFGKAQTTTHSNMYLCWDYLVGTSLGKGSKRRRQQKMTEEGARKIKKSDVPHTNSSVYFLL